MKLDIPDEWLPLIAKATENQRIAGQVLNREDSRYQAIAEFFRNADEPVLRKPAQSESAKQKKIARKA